MNNGLQVFWLTDQPGGRAFPAYRLVAIGGFGPRLQRRARSRFTRDSLPDRYFGVLVATMTIKVKPAGDSSHLKALAIPKRACDSSMLLLQDQT